MAKRKRRDEDQAIRDDDHGQGTLDELLRDAEIMGGGIVVLDPSVLHRRLKK